MSGTLMSNQQTHDADGENLSALFDGELGREATQSALEQLGEDAGAREACGRWQLAGDVLRGNGMAPASPGFSDRVMVRIALEQGHGAAAGRGAFAGASASRGRLRHQPRWIGGALAASVAIAALFVARPMFDREEAAGDASAAREIVAASPGAAFAPTDVPGEFAADATVPFQGAPSDTGGLGADMAVAALAAAATAAPRRGERRSTSAVARSVARSSATTSLDTRVARPESIASDAAALASVNSGEQVQHPRPFMSASVIVAKPWPRAVVPGYGADTAMTAGFHAGAAAPVSFYPFEPSGLRGDSLRGTDEHGPAPATEPDAGVPVHH